MPDGIASFVAGGQTDYATANEGDARPADNVESGHPAEASDEGRFSQLGTSGRPPLDPAPYAVLDLAYGGNGQSDAALGRLNLSLINGDLDADGDIDQPTMFGTRSFSTT